jgi:hypothetical protein
MHKKSDSVVPKFSKKVISMANDCNSKLARSLLKRGYANVDPTKHANLLITKEKAKPTTNY